jgi:tetratricopeptide (TPR) repeat protein
MAKGLKKYAEKAYPDAVDLFTQAIEENNTIAEAYFDRGVCQGLLMNHKAAIADYDTAIVINPTYKEAYLNRGCAEINLSLQTKGEPDGLKMKAAACIDLQKALKLGVNTNELQQMIQFHCEEKRGN